MPPISPRSGTRWPRVSRAFRSWHTIRPSTRGACVPSSTSMECPIPITGSTAPAGLRAGSSGGAFPTTSSTPSRLPAALTWSTTTTPWPMPRPVPGLHSGSSVPFRCYDPDVPGSSHAGTSGDFSFFERRLPAADRIAGCSGFSGQSPSSSWNRISQRL